MVDLQNPTSQFHSYQPPEATPHTESDLGRWGMLKKAGLNDERISSIRNGMGNIDLNGSWNKVRDYARANPGKFLGGMAALVIGAGLLASRRRHHLHRTDTPAM